MHFQNPYSSLFTISGTFLVNKMHVFPMILNYLLNTYLCLKYRRVFHNTLMKDTEESTFLFQITRFKNAAVIYNK